MKQQVLEKVEKISNGILELAGVFSVQNPSARYAGVSKKGGDVYVSKSLADSADITAGSQFTLALGFFVAPFNVLSKKEDDALKELVKTCSNPKLHVTLDKLQQERKADVFAATLIAATKAPANNLISALTSVKIYDHWGVMSPAQKSIAIAAMSIQLHETTKGGPVCDLVIVSGNGNTFKVQDALNMLQSNKNPYGLVLNWEYIYRLCRIYNDKPTNEALIDFAYSHNFLGRDQNDAAVPGVSKANIEQRGGKPAPQYGVGAVAVPSGTPPPGGYEAVTESPTGNVVVPSANAETAVGAVSGSLVGTRGGKNGISGDATSVYKQWPKSSTRDKGTSGGSAFIAGLSQLKSTDPYLFSAMVAQLTCYANKKIDPSNRAEYAASLAGIALARLVTGKSEEKADSDGVALAKSVHSANPADFAKLQISIRAMYANYGVSSKADAYQLSNQAYSEGRICETDLVAMQTIFDIIYDKDGFGLLSKLLSGMDKGLQVAALDLSVTNTMTKGATYSEVADKRKLNPVTDVRTANRAKYAQQQAPQQEVAPSGSV